MLPHIWSTAVVLALLSVGFAHSEETAQRPLHARIDALVENSAIGPLAPRSTDADFVRRIYLDLTGVIPTADQAREFVADPSTTKREQLIDQLLASPAFNRHLTITLDVMLMERKPEKAVKQPEWESFLFHWLADEKPLDALFQELIASDGAEEKRRAASRFVMDRDAEPNLVTRDIGRLALGMDLQCCQCHDHPLIDDYFQADYYSLFAFVHRTSLFTDAKTKLVSLTEKAEGEASFKSVFTGAANDRALPRLPKGAVLFVEPRFRLGDEYQVKPDKSARGVPKFSRRETLAKMLPASLEFSRNLANRLWAIMLGRGLVHPLDFHHAANPPSNPLLLTLLADELAAGHFNVRPFMREIALTRTYQRSFDAPQSDVVNLADVAARLESLKGHQAVQQQLIQPLKAELAAAQKAFQTIESENESCLAEIAKREQAVTESRQSLDKTLSDRKAAEETLGKLKAARTTVAAAAQKLNDAAQLPGGSPLAETVNAIRPVEDKLHASIAAADKQLAEEAAKEQTLTMQLAEAESAVAIAVAARPNLDQLRKLEQKQLAAQHKLSDANFISKAIDSQIALATEILDHAALAASDPVKARTVWAAIVGRWTVTGQVAPLKPLTAEQLGLSIMQATGALASQMNTASAKIAKSPPEALKSATEADKSDLRSRLTQLELLSETRGTLRDFVRQYGGQPGEEFQATVNQALYFGNGGIVDGWLQPAGDNLVQRLAKIDDFQQLADEMSWTVFSRPANETELKAVIAHLKLRDDKAVAIGELAWSLLASTEFRFNH
jgi:hypothetical protein